MSAPKPAPPEYGTCRQCGDAVPPGAATCPICGAKDPIRAGESDDLSPAGRRRYRMLRWTRAGVVAAVVAVLVVLLVQAILTPPPVASNPLSQTSTLRIPPGRFALIAGVITGADYIQGNFTVLDPPGADLTFAIYNTTEFTKFDQNQSAQPMQSAPPQSNGRIVFAALYTDTYDFVWSNAYPSGSGLTLTVYVSTTYETNVVVG